VATVGFATGVIMDNFDAEIFEWVRQTLIAKGGPIEPENRRPGSWREIEAISRQRLAARRRASAEKKDGESKATGEHTVGDFPGHPFRGNQYTKSVDDVVEKGDVQGHPFHGNQWTSGESGKIFDNYRPCDINQTISQIGKMNILGISGGRVNPLRNTAGEPVGVHLPVGKGYGVNVLLHPNDTYTVQRVTTRAGVVKIKGQEDGIYAEDLGDTAYRAGMYVNVPFGDHQGTLG